MQADQQIDTLKRAAALLDTAIELAADARKTWLQELAAKEPGVAAQLETLLAAHARAGEIAFLDQTITPATLAIPVEENRLAKLPVNMGPYRLIRQIGAGGMSTVWLAERTYESFTRQVAIKRLPTFLKNEEHERRLLREAAILAGIDHPNIARLLDAGISTDGDPYIALELIDGEPITAYCDRLRLDVKSRVALMAKVCEAVTFLHQRSVIHRDIKPSNVLVDKTGNVKLLDFGIAKLLDDALVLGEATRSSCNAFTPEYAAPEQINGKTITTATDVYSLGVLLYRMLTGTRPYGRTVPSLLIASAIVNTLPSKPSTLFGPAGEMPKEELTQILEARQASAKQLHANLRNDLDNVLLKALEKEVERRYATVDAFAADLQAWLESRPVQAQRTSPVYVMRKFAERHRGGVAASALAVTGLLVALGFGAWQARQTQLEVVKTKRVLTFLQTLIAEANPNNTGVQTITVLDLLQRAPEVAKKQFPDEAFLQYEALKPIERILRDLEAAESLEPVEKQMVALLPALTKLPPEEAAELRTEYALTLAYLGKFDQADAFVDAALKSLQDADKKGSVAYAQALMRQANVLSLRRRPAEAAELAMKSHAMLVERASAESPLITRSAFELVEMLLNAGRRLDADAIGKKDFTLNQIAAVQSEKERLQYRMLYASLRSNLGDPRTADAQYDSLITESAKFFGTSNAVYPKLLQQGGRAAIEVGNYEKAIRLYSEAETIELKAETKNKITLIGAISQRAIAHLHMNNLTRARLEIENANELIKAGGKPTANYWQAVFQEALLSSNFVGAMKALDEQDAALPPNTPPDALTRSSVMVDRANVYRITGDFVRAVDLNTKALANYRKYMPANHYRFARAELQLAQALAGTGEIKKALEIAELATKQIEGTLGETHPLALQAQYIYGDLEERAGTAAGPSRSLKAAQIYQQQFKVPLSSHVLRLH